MLRLVGGEGFVGGVAEGLERAVGAAGLTGDAERAAVGDDAVGEVDPLGLRDEAHQVALDFFRRGLAGEAEAAGDAQDVRVHDDAVGDARTTSRGRRWPSCGRRRGCAEVRPSSAGLCRGTLR